jgi:hypothetical protein
MVGTIEELNRKYQETLVFFLVPPNFSNLMDWLARTGDTVLVKSKELTGRNTAMAVACERGDKDDRKTKYICFVGLYALSQTMQPKKTCPEAKFLVHDWGI